MKNQRSGAVAWADAVRDDLIDAVIGLDGERMRRLLQGTLDVYGADALVAEVMVPLLRTIGDLWAGGELSVMHEHHASSIIRSVLGEIRRQDDVSGAPSVVLGCPPGELHDLPSHLFAVMLLDRGLRPVLLGANTPLNAFSHAAHATRARACVLVARRERFLVAYRPALVRMGRSTPIFVAGPVSISSRDAAIGLRPLSHDWREAADTIAQVAMAAADSAG